MPVENKDFRGFVNNLQKARIIDPNYPVKGCYVWLPYGFTIRDKLFSYIEELVKKEGYQRYQFPKLVSGQAIRKVTERVADFENRLFWLRRKKGDSLDLFLTPTGECAIYTMFKKWIRQKWDLPIRLYQVGSIFRFHKRPNVLLNGDELTNLLESYAAFSSRKESNTEFQKMIEVYKKILETMKVPFLSLHRPIEGNNPVYIDMVSFESYLPSKNTNFNLGALYNQAQIFSKAFDVTFTDKNGQKDNSYHVAFGISERSLAAMLDLHRDEHGLRILPGFAPLQIVIIPVYDKGEKYKLNKYIDKIKRVLEEDYSVAIDKSNKNPSKKLAVARQQGIPIRIGISKINMDNETVRLYIRTSEVPLEKIPIGSLKKIINNSFIKIEGKLFEDANDFLQSKIRVATDLDEAYQGVKERLITKIYWCGKSSCFHELDKKLPGELIGTELDLDEPGSCLICRQKVSNPSYYARRASSP